MYFAGLFLFSRWCFSLDKWRKIAEENGISYKVFRDRVNKLGWSLEKASTKPLKPNRAKDHTWRQIAKKNNINISTYRSRVRSGWSYNKAATTPTIQQKRDDQEWLDLARSNGISYETYRYRVDELLWDPKKAATTTPMSRKESSKLGIELQKQYNEINNKRLFNDESNLFKLTKKHLDVAEENGINKRTAEARVYAYGWTVQEAITRPVVKSKFIKPDNYEKHLKIAKKNGIKIDTFKARLRRGWSPERASTEKLRIKGYYNRPDGKWIDRAIKNDISADTYKYRVDLLGWTQEEASSIKPLNNGEYLNEDTKQRARNGFAKFRGK